jgi:hypothetical protein
MTLHNNIIGIDKQEFFLQLCKYQDYNLQQQLLVEPMNSIKQSSSHKPPPTIIRQAAVQFYRHELPCLASHL